MSKKTITHVITQMMITQIMMIQMMIIQKAMTTGRKIKILAISIASAAIPNASWAAPPTSIDVSTATGILDLGWGPIMEIGTIVIGLIGVLVILRLIKASLF